VRGCDSLCRLGCPLGRVAPERVINENVQRHNVSPIVCPLQRLQAAQNRVDSVKSQNLDMESETGRIHRESPQQRRPQSSLQGEPRGEAEEGAGRVRWAAGREGALGCALSPPLPLLPLTLTLLGCPCYSGGVAGVGLGGTGLPRGEEPRSSKATRRAPEMTKAMSTRNINWLPSNIVPPFCPFWNPGGVWRLLLLPPPPGAGAGAGPAAAPEERWGAKRGLPHFHSAFLCPRTWKRRMGMRPEELRSSGGWSPYW